MSSPRSHHAVATALAAAFLDGAWNERGMTVRGRAGLQQPPPRWVPGLVREVLELHPRPPRDAPRALAELITVLLARRDPTPSPARVRRQPMVATAMGQTRFAVPAIADPAALATLLDLNIDRLAWLADTRGLGRRNPDRRGHHYHVTWIPRRDGRPRPIERPKPQLKAAQRTVLRAILDRIPAHAAAHGFVAGRSVRTHAAEHVAQRVVLRIDLEDFFAGVGAARVRAVLRAVGYPETVADALTALCTTTMPVTTWAAVARPREPQTIAAHHRLGRRLATPHLPQGAPTSPALANLAAHGLDRRLAALAASVGAHYTRYADDLTFSGDADVLVAARAIRAATAQIARDEGFRVNGAKGRLMTDAGRQEVCGIVVNRRTNVTRGEYDALKAILHNAARTGAAAQNREGRPDFRAHLTGRVAWVASLHPQRGDELRRRLSRVRWDDG